MAKCTGGTFNKLSRSYGKTAKVKTRDKKKLAGTKVVGLLVASAKAAVWVPNAAAHS